jgi:hypothetical protein
MTYTIDPWCTDDEYRRIETATSFPELVAIAIEAIARNRKPSQPVIQVCGPMTPMTSGGGTLESNTEKIAQTVAALRGNGLTVFSQVTFQRGMLNFTTTEDYRQNPLRLLDGFYGELFRGRHIQMLAFLKNWERSLGCRWEHEMGISLGMKISYLSYPEPLYPSRKVGTNPEGEGSFRQ